MQYMSAPARWLIATTLSLLFVGCITVFRRVEVAEVPVRPGDMFIQTPLKAHLTNGHVVVFQRHATYSQGSRTLRGAGVLYGLDLTPSSIEAVSIDSVAAMETFSTDVQELTSMLVTVGLTAVGALATAAAAVAIFGSCPTVYSNGELQAETFSNSISRLMEVRDVDRLEITPGGGDRVTLEFRNEALETHYINHIELLRADHSRGETAVPQPSGRALLLSDLVEPVAIDRTGSDRSEQLKHRDGDPYRTPSEILENARVGDLTDFIDLTIPSPGTDSAAVLIRGRTSLLTTVLLYDFMLSQGPATLDYTGIDLESISEAMALGALFREHFGIRVHVLDNGSWQRVGRVGTSGPVAWETTGLRIPVPSGDSLRVRLEFLADSWRFDQILIAGQVREATVTRLPVTSVEGYSIDGDRRALEGLLNADENYHITFPGQSFAAIFVDDVKDSSDGTSTYFLAAQGYYTEWIRRDWFDRPTRRFEATEDVLADVLKQWRQRGSWYEENFFSSRVPTRSIP